MASENKKSKTNKRHHWGRDGKYLKKNEVKVKGLSFYNSCDRQALKRELTKLLREEVICGSLK